MAGEDEGGTRPAQGDGGEIVESTEAQQRTLKDALRTIGDYIERGGDFVALFHLAQEMANVVKDEVVCPQCQAEAGDTCHTRGKPFTPQHKGRWLAAIRGDEGPE
jgi:hypothetical protein